MMAGTKSLKALLEFEVKCGAVWQAGKTVIQCLCTQVFLQAPLLGYVTHRHRPSAVTAIGSG